ncbi:Hypothetical predicted protein [Mytilus galloprovincialis]|uniref:SMB domain-containing protein n=1 Tax=Mytilus galloprovincialis TaxID=29158 RepID=A0A8B6HTL9_MYTGA|nr:Hypothetical predicted protein [Mytilus galloprovincialis]
MTSSILICILCTYVMLILCVTGVAGDECCKEYTVLSGRKIDAKWCPRYCCYDTIYHDYICCEDESKRALSDHREEFCSKWWSAHLNGATITGKPHKFMTDMTINGTIAMHIVFKEHHNRYF